MSTNTAWTARYRDALTDRLGLEVEQLDNGALLVDLGLRFLISNYAEKDPEYLQVSTSFAMEGPVDADVLRIARDVSLRSKGATVLPTDDGLLVSIGHPVTGPNRLPDPAHLADVLPRVFDMIAHAASMFHTEHTLHGIQRSSLDAA